jgi:hypothetical protein
MPQGALELRILTFIRECQFLEIRGFSDISQGPVWIAILFSRLVALIRSTLRHSSSEFSGERSTLAKASCPHLKDSFQPICFYDKRICLAGADSGQSRAQKRAAKHF